MDGPARPGSMDCAPFHGHPWRGGPLALYLRCILRIAQRSLRYPSHSYLYLAGLFCQTTTLGYEASRLERAPWADTDPNLYPGKGVDWAAIEGVDWLEPEEIERKVEELEGEWPRRYSYVGLGDQATCQAHRTRCA